MSIFSGNDLIFYKNTTTGNIMSGGYSIDSILLREGYSPITTLNTNTNTNTNTNPDNQSGGESQNVSNIFENMVVPSGLFYYNNKGGKINEDDIGYENGNKSNNESGNESKNESKNESNNQGNINYTQSKCISDDLHDKLFKLIEVRVNKNIKSHKNKNQANKPKKYTRKIK